MARVLDKMETIGDLQGIGSTEARSIGIRFGPIPDDDLDAGMATEPGGQCLRIAALEQINWPVRLEIHQDRGVGVPAPQGEIVHPKDAGSRHAIEERVTQQAQQRIRTDGKTGGVSQACPCLAAG
jgi:hypothetical protein